MRHVADRMPDRGKRGKDIAILQMGQDAYRNISQILELRCVGNDQAVLALRSGGGTKPSPRPATRSELTRTRYVASWPNGDVAKLRGDFRL